MVVKKSSARQSASLPVCQSGSLAVRLGPLHTSSADV